MPGIWRLATPLRRSTLEGLRARTDTRPEERPVRARTYLIGAALAATYAFLAPYSLYGLYSCRLDQGMLPVGVLLLFALLLVVNAVSGTVVRGARLRVWELAVILGMMWVGAAALQIGVLHNSLGVMSAPEYFASPENRWGEYYLPYIPSWAIPRDTYDAVRMFYNGAMHGRSVPWEAWVVPLFWWGSFLAALLGAIVSLMSVVHEQWHQHEKLTFPMADIGLTLMGAEEDGVWKVSWLRSKGFWIAAAVPFLILVWNSFHAFSAAFPVIGITQAPSEIAVRYLPTIVTRLDPYILGIAYFAPVQILRGMWMGFLIIGVEIGLGQKFGFAEGINPGFEPWSDWGTQTTAWQCLGSIVLWVLWGFWVGREHFKRVIRVGLGLPTELPDRIRKRYRASFWGFVLSISYLALWFRALGMEWPVVLLFLPMVFILALGIAKTIAMGSFMQVEGPVSAQTFVMQTMGTAFISQASMAALVLSYVTFRSSDGIMMSQVAFASRMGDARGASRGRLYLGIGIAVFVVLAVGTMTMIYLGYDVGAFNFGSHAFRVGHIEAYRYFAVEEGRGDQHRLAPCRVLHRRDGSHGLRAAHAHMVLRLLAPPCGVHLRHVRSGQHHGDEYLPCVAHQVRAAEGRRASAYRAGETGVPRDDLRPYAGCRIRYAVRRDLLSRKRSSDRNRVVVAPEGNRAGEL